METPQTPIRVVLIDDRFVIHQLVSTLIQSAPDIELVGQAFNGKEGIELCQQLNPDLVLMDVMMPVMDGIEATRQIHAALPGVKLLVVSSVHDHDSVHAMLQSGAAGYIVKSALAQDLLDTIRATYHGKQVFSSEAVAQLLVPKAVYSEVSTNFNLTPREKEILKMMGKGLNIPEIANDLVISQSTVKFHIENICHKMGVDNRSQALVLATKNHLI